MRRYLNHQANVRPACAQRGRRRITRAVVLTLSLIFVLIPAGSLVHAEQTVLPVKPGWDVFDPGTGYVIYSVTSSRRSCQPKLQIAYILQGAKPLQKYDVAFGIFNLPGEGLKFFGVPRFLRNTFAPEGISAIHDSFIVGTFATDRFGNGKTQVELDLTGVPAGSYDAQFTWTRRTDTRGFYRTGSKYGEGFGKIIVP